MCYSNCSPSVAPYRDFMPLSQQQIKDTPAPASGRISLTDGRGLQLRITNKNVRTWSLQYRYEGRALKLSLGEWPSVSISEARKLADEARLLIAKGINPQVEKKAAKLKKLTFHSAWEMFDALHITEKKPTTAREYRRSAEVDILPYFKSVALEDVTKSDVVALIDKIRKRAPIMANRTLSYLSKFFNWCLGRDHIKLNPALGIPKVKETKRDRVLSLEELRSIYKAAGKLSAGNQLLVKLMLLTGQRESVVARLERSEIKENYLDISGERNKSGERIKVFLSELAQRLISELGSSDGRYVVSTTNGERPVSGFSKLKHKLDTLTGIEEPWRFHDIRRGITTYLEENGLDRIYTQRILNHKDQSVTGIYARPEHKDYVARVLEQWSLVLSAEDGFDAGNVLIFSR